MSETSTHKVGEYKSNDEVIMVTKPVKCVIVTPVLPKAPTQAQVHLYSYGGGRAQFGFDDGGYISGRFQVDPRVENAYELVQKAPEAKSLRPGSSGFYRVLNITVHDDGKGADLSVFNETGAQIVVAQVTIDPDQALAWDASKAPMSDSEAASDIEDEADEDEEDEEDEDEDED